MRVMGQLPFDAGNSPACSGSDCFGFDQAYAAAQGITQGQTIFAQIWSRDSGFAPPLNVGLTNALQLTFCP